MAAAGRAALDVVAAGELYKLKSSVPLVGESWNKRWFQLELLPLGPGRREVPHLSYYPLSMGGRGSGKPTSIAMSDVTSVRRVLRHGKVVIRRAEAMTTRRTAKVDKYKGLCFEVDCAAKHYILRATDTQDLEYWLSALKAHAPGAGGSGRRRPKAGEGRTSERAGGAGAGAGATGEAGAKATRVASLRSMGHSARSHSSTHSSHSRHTRHRHHHHRGSSGVSSLEPGLALDASDPGSPMPPSLLSPGSLSSSSHRHRRGGKGSSVQAASSKRLRSPRPSTADQSLARLSVLHDNSLHMGEEAWDEVVAEVVVEQAEAEPDGAAMEQGGAAGGSAWRASVAPSDDMAGVGPGGGGPGAGSTALMAGQGGSSRSLRSHGSGADGVNKGVSGTQVRPRHRRSAAPSKSAELRARVEALQRDTEARRAAAAAAAADAACPDPTPRHVGATGDAAAAGGGMGVADGAGTALDLRGRPSAREATAVRLASRYTGWAASATSTARAAAGLGRVVPEGMLSAPSDAAGGAGAAAGHLGAEAGRLAAAGATAASAAAGMVSGVAAGAGAAAGAAGVASAAAAWSFDALGDVVGTVAEVGSALPVLGAVFKAMGAAHSKALKAKANVRQCREVAARLEVMRPALAQVRAQLVARHQTPGAADLDAALLPALGNLRDAVEETRAVVTAYAKKGTLMRTLGAGGLKRKFDVAAGAMASAVADMSMVLGLATHRDVLAVGEATASGVRAVAASVAAGRAEAAAAAAADAEARQRFESEVTTQLQLLLSLADAQAARAGVAAGTGAGGAGAGADGAMAAGPGTVMPQQAHPRLPTYVIAKERVWPLGRRLGRGAFGDVHAATWNACQVAVKAVRAEAADAAMLKALNREAYILTRLPRHPCLVQFYGLVVADPTYALVMELVPGGTLARALALAGPPTALGGGLSWRRRLEVAASVAAGLSRLHAVPPPLGPIVHGDLKSGNVMLEQGLEAGRVVVVDFGLSAAATETSRTTESGGGGAGHSSSGGSLRWSAPERMGGRPTPAADVYSLGVVMWELGACATPFRHVRTEAEVVALVTAGRRPDLAAMHRGAPEGYAGLVQRCWTEDPKRRPSASEVHAELLAMQGGGGLVGAAGAGGVSPGAGEASVEPPPPPVAVGVSHRLGSAVPAIPLPALPASVGAGAARPSMAGAASSVATAAADVGPGGSGLESKTDSPAAPTAMPADAPVPASLAAPGAVPASSARLAPAITTMDQFLESHALLHDASVRAAAVGVFAGFDVATTAHLAPCLPDDEDVVDLLGALGTVQGLNARRLGRVEKAVRACLAAGQAAK